MNQPMSASNPGAERFADSTMPDLAQPGSPTGEGGAVPVVTEVDAAGFPALVERSNAVPVVLVLTAQASQPSQDLAKTMAGLIEGYGGRLLMGQVDLVDNPAVGQALGVQAVPTVLALIKGQPVPLFQGVAEAEQIKAVLDQILAAAAQAGVNGQLSEGGEVEVPVPPLHQAGYDALEQGDLAGARQAFNQALAEAPADATAKAALAQIALLERLEQPDAGAVAETTQAPLATAMAAADEAVATGQFGQGFDLLLAQLPGASAEDRETIRLRLLELFEVAGPDCPDVGTARRRLATALF